MVARLSSCWALLGTCMSLMMMSMAPATCEADASGTAVNPSSKETTSCVPVCGAYSRNCSQVGRALLGAESAGMLVRLGRAAGAAARPAAARALVSAAANTVRAVGKAMEPSRSRERSSWYQDCALMGHGAGR